MKLVRAPLFVCFLVILLGVPSRMFVSGSNDFFYPPIGTVSTYWWNFDNFPNICALNGTHIDMNNYNSYNDVCIENPTFSEFSVSYNMFGDFLEEAIYGNIHNATTSLRFQPSYLINVSSRIYVNDQGNAVGGYANGYIDPRGVSIGSQIHIGLTSINVVAKEIITVIGMERKAWKLEYKTEVMNQTFHYDVTTGILLAAKLESFEGSIGSSIDRIRHSIHALNNGYKIISHEQLLISTNAWTMSQTTSLPLFEIIILIWGLTIIYTKKSR